MGKINFQQKAVHELMNFAPVSYEGGIREGGATPFRIPAEQEILYEDNVWAMDLQRLDFTGSLGLRGISCRSRHHHVDEHVG